MLVVVDSSKDISGRDEWAGVERDLGQWDDGYADTHQDREELRIAA